jgi:serine protease Do
MSGPVQADTLFDEGRLQGLLQTQKGVLVRVKSIAEDKPIVLEETGRPQNVSLGAKEVSAKDEGKKEPKTFLRLGTGFFVSSDGLILTNASVVDQAKRVWYEVDGIAYLAEVKGVDVPTNLALLQAKTMPKKFSTVNLTDSVTLPQAGSFLVRLSLPMDFPSTPTVGMVQGADTQFGMKAFPTRYLRVQLNTGPGEAGAPVFDLWGKFVGVTVAVLPELQATYVLPGRAVDWVCSNMTPKGRQYGYFGFNVEEDHSVEDSTRLIVKTVDPKGPAIAANIKEGDIIEMAGGKEAATLGDLRDAAFYTKPGQYLDLKIKRGNEEMNVSVQAIEKK